MSYEAMNGLGSYESLGDETDGLLGRPGPIQVTGGGGGTTTSGARPTPVRPTSFQVSPLPSSGGAGGRPTPIAPTLPGDGGGLPGTFHGKPLPGHAPAPPPLVYGGGFPILPTPFPTNASGGGSCAPCETKAKIPWFWICLGAAAGIGGGYLAKQEMDKKKGAKPA